MGGRGGHRTPAALEPDPDRTPVRMRRFGPRIAEDVVGQAEQSAQSSSGRMEHMFARLSGGSDGTSAAVGAGLLPHAEVSPAGAPANAETPQMHGF